MARAITFALAFGLFEVGLAAPTISSRADILPLTEQEITARLVRGTTEVLALGCDLSLRQGTGTVIGSDKVLTNQHVVGSYRRLDLSAADAPLLAPASVSTSGRADLAAMSVSGLPSTALPIAPFDPLPKEQVWLAGYPQGATSAESDGLVLYRANVIDYVDGKPMGQAGRVMRLDVSARPGMSGGPVLDQAGRLAGIVFGVQSPTGDSVVLPISVVEAALAAPLNAASLC